MYKNNDEYIRIIDGKIERFYIRSLSENDIVQIGSARKAQEEENGNGATKEYIEEYKKGLLRLFNENNLIGAGAFKKDKLVSIAFFNLISFGEEKKIPYLCGVWTDPRNRRRNLATQINKKLMQGLLERQDELQKISLLTIEGNEAAQKLYNKLGYEFVKGEMTFLGDVCKPKTPVEHTTSKENEYTDEVRFYHDNLQRMKIIYSKENFFPHPNNLSGKMTRILGIYLLQEGISVQEFTEYMQEFFRTHRFCKLNINELIAKEKGLGQIFKLDNNNVLGLIDAFSKMNFEGNSGESLKMKPSYNIMKKDILPEILKINGTER